MTWPTIYVEVFNYASNSLFGHYIDMTCFIKEQEVSFEWCFSDSIPPLGSCLWALKVYHSVEWYLSTSSIALEPVASPSWSGRTESISTGNIFIISPDWQVNWPGIQVLQVFHSLGRRLKISWWVLSDQRRRLCDVCRNWEGLFDVSGGGGIYVTWSQGRYTYKAARAAIKGH